MSPFDLPTDARPGRDQMIGQDELGNPVYRTMRGTQYTVPERVSMPAPAMRDRFGMVGEAARGATMGGIFDVVKQLGRGIYEGLEQGVTAPRRALQGQPMTMGDAAATAGMGIVGAAGGAAPAGSLRSGISRSGDPEGIRAFHGSPHDFDRFDMSKIGTGEGAQAYGRGMYFSEAEDVARMYRDQLSGGNTAAARRTLEAADGNVDQAIAQTRQRLDRLDERAAAGDFGGDQRRFAAQRQIQQDKLQQLNAFRETGSFDQGRMYEVNISARPEEFLDWETPLSQQPQIAERLGLRTRSTREIDDEAYALFDQYGSFENMPPDVRQRISQLTDEANLPATTQTGEQLYQFGIGAQENVHDFLSGPSLQRSQELLEAGIPGITYRDPSARGAAAGARNLVVFDDNLISIVRKYGIAGAATMLGVTAADVQSALADNMPQSEWESLVVGQ